MRHIAPAVIATSILAALHPVSADAELYRCDTPDGTEIYTNKKEDLTNCKEYTPHSKLGVLPAPPVVPQIEPPALDDSAYERSTPPRHDTRVPGQISFETFRMLSTGMTETEVLVRAGPPRYKFRLSIGTIVWAYANDDWIIEVTFSGGRVADINRYRPRP